MRNPKSRFFILVLLAWALSSTVSAQWDVETLNRGNAQVGSNYYGQSLSLNYSHKIFDHVWAGMALERATFSLDFNSGSTFLFFTNNSQTNYHIGFDIPILVSSFISIEREAKGMIRFVNSLAVGITYFDMTANVSTSSNNGSSIYQGGKEISAFALYTGLHLIDLYPPQEKVHFSLGIKGNMAWLSNPQRVDLTNGSGGKGFAILYSADGSPILVPYPELFFEIGYSF